MMAKGANKFPRVLAGAALVCGVGTLSTTGASAGTTNGSLCAGTCATYWPALTASGAMTLGAGIKKSEVEKAKGQKPNQVTYYGHLLYYYVGDTAPGQTAGTKITGWHLLGPFGNVMLPKG